MKESDSRRWERMKVVVGEGGGEYLGVKKIAGGKWHEFKVRGM